MLNRKNQFVCVLDYYENLSKAVDIEKQKAQNALQNNDKVRISEETLYFLTRFVQTKIMVFPSTIHFI